MPLRITQQESQSGWKGSNGQSANTEQQHEATVFKVQGSLYLEDAELLEKICRDLTAQGANHITLDLADLSFLDSDGASVLCRLRREQNVTLEGLHLFIAKVIELTEAEASVSEYLPRGSQERQCL